MKTKHLLIALVSASLAVAQEPLPMPKVTGFTVIATSGSPQAEIGPLEEGGVIYSTPQFARMSSDRSIRVDVMGGATAVQVTIAYVTVDGQPRTHTDMKSPHSLCGDFESGGTTRYWGCPALRPEGEAIITATPWDGDRKGTGLSVSFTISRPLAESTEPETDDGAEGGPGGGGFGGGGSGGGGSGGGGFTGRFSGSQANPKKGPPLQISQNPVTAGTEVTITVDVGNDHRPSYRSTAGGGWAGQSFIATEGPSGELAGRGNYLTLSSTNCPTHRLVGRRYVPLDAWPRSCTFTVPSHSCRSGAGGNKCWPVEVSFMSVTGRREHSVFWVHRGCILVRHPSDSSVVSGECQTR